MGEKLLELKNISKRFALGGKREVVALKEIDLTLYEGETLGILGESGCGKSTLARVIMGVYPPSTGEIRFRGKPLSLQGRRARKTFAKDVQMIFQDPYTSLDPHMTVQAIIAENLIVHEKCDAKEQMAKVSELLQMIGLSSAYACRFPHEFSGGQRQRIGIARALAAQPKCLICDEPLSALDTSVQRHIMDLLLRLKRDMQLTYLFISHDLNTIRHIADRVAVMYAGEIVEMGQMAEIYANPHHPYTKMLLQAALFAQADQGTYDLAPMMQGVNHHGGCAFANRCPLAMQQCREEKPQLLPCGEHHIVKCHAMDKNHEV